MNLYIYPLQGLQEFNISNYSDNTVHAVIFCVGFLLIAGTLIFLNVSKKVQSSKAFSTGTIDIFDDKTPNAEGFRHLAKMYELKKDEAIFLKDVVVRARCTPDQVLEEKDLIDKLFKTEYQGLSREAESSSEAKKDLEKMFLVRNAIAYFDINAELMKNPRAAPRRTPRKEASLHCDCSVVTVVKVKENRKLVKKLKLSGEHFDGTLVDLSIGGCALSTDASAKTGTQLRIEFRLGTRQTAALGKVLRINSSRGLSTVHIQFQKVQPKSLSAINAFVYGYI